MKEKRLIRSRNDRMFLGVAGGIGEYLNIDPVLVRLLFVFAALSTLGQALLVYFILAIIMPEEDMTAKANPFDEDEIVINS
ncbi:MAG TPA: PspC domain-containing protein [Candidatus Binatia bacterium]|nr:PspC domain-containing protein [Candidatus Binatia bacterium]